MGVDQQGGNTDILEKGQRTCSFIVIEGIAKSGQWSRKELVKLAESFDAQQGFDIHKRTQAGTVSFDAFFEILDEVMLKKKVRGSFQNFPGSGQIHQRGNHASGPNINERIRTPLPH